MIYLERWVEWRRCQTRTKAHESDYQNRGRLIQREEGTDRAGGK